MMLMKEVNKKPKFTPSEFEINQPKVIQKYDGDKSKNRPEVETRTIVYIQDNLCSDLQTERKKIQEISSSVARQNFQENINCINQIVIKFQETQFDFDTKSMYVNNPITSPVIRSIIDKE